MSLLDFLYLSLAFGFLILVGFISFACYRLAKTLQSVDNLINNAEDIVKDIRDVKNHLKSGLITTFITAVNVATQLLTNKGGGKHK